MNNDRDRLLSYVQTALDDLDNYINYRGRNFKDLIALQQEIDKLTESINKKLITNFKAETIEYLHGKRN